MKQLSFASQKILDEKLRKELNPPKVFGGSLLVGKRKSKRPLSTRHPIDMVLRCDISRSGSLLRHADTIHHAFQKFAAKFNVKIYRKAIVSNHIHLVIKFGDRKSYNSFVRACSGAIAQKLKVVWELRPFTRIVSWGRHFRNALDYVLQNELEAKGIIPYTIRKKPRIKSSSSKNAIAFVGIDE